MKKILTLVLSIIMIANIAVFQTVVSATGEVYETSLVSVISGGDFENGIPGNLTFTAGYGTGTVVADPLDGTNNVLYMGGSTNTNATFIGLPANTSDDKKWYMDADVYAANSTYVYFSDGWGWYDYATQQSTGQYVSVSTYATATNTAWTKLQKTVEDDGDATKSLWLWTRSKDSPFYIDNLKLYNVTNAYEITVPAEVTVDPLSYAVINGNMMANAGDTIRLTAQEGYTLSVGGNELTPEEDGSYLYEMQAANLVVTATPPIYITTLENIVIGGDMESGTSNIVSIGEGNSYYPQPAYVKDPENDKNTVMSVTGVSGQGQPLVEVKGYTPITGHTYSFTAKLRGTMSPFFVTSKLWPYGGDPYGTVSITGITNSEWKDVAVTHTATDASPRALIFGYSNTSGNSFKLDDVSIYDITNAHNILATAGITVNPLSYAVINGNMMANAGDVVKFRVNGGSAVEVIGAVATLQGDGSYTFIMPSSDVTIEAKYVNIVPDGDMEAGEDSKFYDPYYGSTGHDIDYITDSGNTYLRLDARDDTGSSSQIRYAIPVLANNKYFVKFDLMCSDETAAAHSSSGVSFWFQMGNTGFSGWMTTGKFTQFEKVLNVGSTGSSVVYWIANPVPDAMYSLDNVEIYNITGSKTVSYYSSYGVIVPQEGENYVIDEVNGNIYAQAGAVITFKVDPSVYAGRNIKLTGVTRVDDETYTMTVTDNASISVDFVEDISYTIGDGTIDVNIASAGSRKVAVANYSSGETELLSSYFADASTNAAHQTVTLTPGITVGADTKIFCWEDFTGNILALRDAYKVVPDAKIFLAGDSTCVEYTPGGELQGWGYSFKDLVRDNATVVNEAMAGDTITNFLASSRYTDMTSKWSAGDYLAISYGINDSALVSSATFKSNLKTLVQTAKSAGVTPILIQEQHTTAREGNANYATFRNIVAEVGDETDTVVLNLYSETVSMPQVCRTRDRIHLTRLGAQYVAEAVAKLLQSEDTDLKYYIK